VHKKISYINYFSARRISAGLVSAIAAFALSACSTIDLSERNQPERRSAPAPSSTSSTAASPASPSSSATPSTATAPKSAGAEVKKPGGYYKDDGPAETIPDGLVDTPDAEPKNEPIAKGPSKPYSVLDQTYTPITDERPYMQRGKGSWYGKKFHGQRTASGEIYDMFKMTAAHPTLPIPSYARVTNLRNGKQVIVRINDRGPFHASRIIDLSYTAALKLDYVHAGSAELEVERILPEEIARMQEEKRRKGLLARAAESPDPMVRLANGSTPPVAAESGGFFLQFGAYAQTHNADAMRVRLLAGWPQELPEPVIVQTGGLYRLHSGPFLSRESAKIAADVLKEVSQIQTAIVQK
jgi:rare lipoprotein A